jgi:hypothetical protein
MDVIGLEKLVEMFEARFGKPAANMLIGLVALAVIGGSVHLIWQHLLLPTFEVTDAIVGWLASKLSFHFHFPALPMALTMNHHSWAFLLETGLLIGFGAYLGWYVRRIVHLIRVMREREDSVYHQLTAAEDLRALYPNEKPVDGQALERFGITRINRPKRGQT